MSGQQALRQQPGAWAKMEGRTFLESASIDDPRPSVEDAEAKKEFAAKRAALVKRAGAAKKAAH